MIGIDIIIAYGLKAALEKGKISVHMHIADVAAGSRSESAGERADRRSDDVNAAGKIGRTKKRT